MIIARDIGPYQVEVEINKHKFVFKAHEKGSGLNLISELIPPDEAPEADGHSPYLKAAKKVAGLDLRYRRRDIPPGKQTAGAEKV